MAETSTTALLDITSLRKGDTVSAAVLEAYLGIPQTHEDFNLRVLNLRKAIETLARAKGEPVTTRMVNKGLQVMLDAEASEYNHASFKAGLNKSVRANVRMTEVVVDNLNSVEKIQHEHNMRLQLMHMQAIRKVEKKLPEKDRMIGDTNFVAEPWF